jgi:hypothetical protein
MPPSGSTPWQAPPQGGKTPEEKLTQLNQKAHSAQMRLFGQNEMSGLDPNLAPKVNRATVRTMELFEGYLLDDPATAWSRALGDAYREVTGQQATLDRLPGRETSLFGKVKNIDEAKAAVQTAREQGTPDVHIKESLAEQGWGPAEIQQIMGTAETAAPTATAAAHTAAPETPTQASISDDEAQARYNSFRAKGYTPDQAAAMAYGN